MSYNGSGTFNINTAGQPVVTGTTITSTAFNLLTADLATGLSTALTKDGQSTPTANIPMGTFKITGLGAGTAATDAAQYGQLQAGATQIATVTGTDTFVGTLSPALGAYASGNLFSFVAPNTNTGASTINLNSLGAKNITKQGSTALASGDIVSGRIYLIEYDGTRFQLINPSASSVSSFSAGSTGFTPSTATTGAVTLAGTLATTNGGTGLTSFTANGVVYASSTSALTTGSALTFDGTNFLTTGSATGTAFIPSGSTVPTNGMYLPTTNSVAWSTNTTERMRLDASGNLGLGVTPSAWSSSYKAFDINSSSSLAAYSSGMSMFQNCYWNGTNFIYKTTAAASAMSTDSGTFYWRIAPSGTAGNAITFTQAMTLDASGNLLVGQTSSGAVNSNSWSFTQSAAGQLVGNHASGSASGSIYIGFYYNTTGIGSITQSGTTAVLYNVTSDQRLKENIQDAESASTLIDSLQVRQFDWKTDNTHQRYGFIAQELVTVAPEAVHQPTDPDEMMAVDYSKLVPMLVKEIQSLRQRLAAAGI